MEGQPHLFETPPCTRPKDSPPLLERVKRLRDMLESPPQTQPTGAQVIIMTPKKRPRCPRSPVSTIKNQADLVPKPVVSDGQDKEVTGEKTGKTEAASSSS